MRTPGGASSASASASAGPTTGVGIPLGSNTSTLTNDVPASIGLLTPAPTSTSSSHVGAPGPLGAGGVLNPVPSPYASLLTPAPSGYNSKFIPSHLSTEPVILDPHDPFRYPREHVLNIWRAGIVANGGPGWRLPLEVEKHEGVVLDEERVPICSREMTDAEAKLYNGASLNSRRPSMSHANSHASGRGSYSERDGELGIGGRRGMSGDGLSMNLSGAGLRGGALGGPASPLRERFSRRDSGGTTQPYRPRQLASTASPLDGTPPLVSPRTASSGFGFGGGPGFEGVLSAGEGWGGRKRGALSAAGRGLSYLKEIQEKGTAGKDDVEAATQDADAPLEPHSESPEAQHANGANANDGTRKSSDGEEPAFENWEDDPDIVDNATTAAATNGHGTVAEPTNPVQEPPKPPPNPADVKWLYLDDQQVTQGPFTPQDLTQWLASGWLRPDLRMTRPDHDAEYLTLIEWKTKMFGQGITDESMVFFTWYEPVRKSPKVVDPPLPPPPGLAMPQPNAFAQNIASIQQQSMYPPYPNGHGGGAPSETETSKSETPSVFDLLRKGDTKGSQTPSSVFGGSGEGVFSHSPVGSNRLPMRTPMLDPAVGMNSPATGRAIPHSGSFDAANGLVGDVTGLRMPFSAAALNQPLGGASSFGQPVANGMVYNPYIGGPHRATNAYYPQDAARVGTSSFGGTPASHSLHNDLNPLGVAGLYSQSILGRGSQDLHSSPSAQWQRTHAGQPYGFGVGDQTNSTTSSLSNMQRATFGGRRSPSPSNQASVSSALGGEVYEGAIGAQPRNLVRKMGSVSAIGTEAGATDSPASKHAETLYKSPMQPVVSSSGTQAEGEATPADTIGMTYDAHLKQISAELAGKSQPAIEKEKVVESPSVTQPAVQEESKQKEDEPSNEKAVAAKPKASPVVSLAQLVIGSSPASQPVKEQNEQPFIQVKKRASAAQVAASSLPTPTSPSTTAPVASPTAPAAPAKMTVPLASLVTNPSPAASTPPAPAPAPRAWATVVNKDEPKTLKEIQEAEAKKAKEAQKVRPSAPPVVTTSSSSSKDGDLGTLSWGLPTSMAGARNATTPKEAHSPSTNNPPPAVWANAAKAGAAGGKKAMTMKDIQEEEERRKKKEREAVTTAKRVSEKPPPPANAPAVGGPWATVGPGGRATRPNTASSTTQPVATGIAGLPPRPSAAAIASSGMRAPHVTSAVASMGATPAAGPAPRRPASASTTSSAVTKPAVAPSPIDDAVHSISAETLKWMRDTLKGKLQNGITVDEVVGLVLNMQEEDDIADTIWQSSTVLPGKHFASEFIERRNADRMGGATSSSRGAPRGGNVSSGTESSRLQPGASQDTLGYKVVKKKGKSGKA
ncbi:SubName: Full=Related to GYF domain protein-Aspergillus flavus NRRL3357 {ECO:0000313/EMBL:CCA74430.1} [Serendipita indica DSM 11827]|nr:SubName: Full=Related to GYF domain protein-Aspergillus flavus NRRL3357 {ECO:0000313/EMBL:CCA74430.1} [Serendipita indica DSM 11827]